MHAFRGCTGLTSATIGNSVKTIEERIFYGCNKLVAINVDTNNPNFSSDNGVLFNKDKTLLCCYPAGKNDSNYEIPNSVTTIGKFVFYGCNNLTSVTIPNSVTTIDNQAFYACHGLTSIVIPNSVTTIGIDAFMFCIKLTSLTIGNSVSSIGWSAFLGCSDLKEIYYGAENPVTATEGIFSDYKNPTLYVKASAMDKIKATIPWSLFEKIEAYGFSEIDDITLDNRQIDYSAEYEVYNLSGQKMGGSLEGLAPGVYMIRQGRKIEKRMIK